MYSVEIQNLKRNCVAIVLHHPASAGHYSSGADCAIVRNSPGWLERAQTKLGSRVRLYDDGSAFLGLGGYGRPIHGTWEKFTAAEIADPVNRVRVIG